MAEGVGPLPLSRESLAGVAWLLNAASRARSALRFERACTLYSSAAALLHPGPFSPCLSRESHLSPPATAHRPSSSCSSARAGVGARLAGLGASELKGKTTCEGQAAARTRSTGEESASSPSLLGGGAASALTDPSQRLEKSARALAAALRDDAEEAADLAARELCAAAEALAERAAAAAREGSEAPKVRLPVLIDPLGDEHRVEHETEARAPDEDGLTHHALELEALVGQLDCYRLLGQTARYVALLSELRGMIEVPSGRETIAGMPTPPHAGAAAVALVELLDEIFSGQSRLASGETFAQGIPPARPAVLAMLCGQLLEALSHSLPTSWSAVGGGWAQLASCATSWREYRLSLEAEADRETPVVGRPSPVVLSNLEALIEAGFVKRDAADAAGTARDAGRRRTPANQTRVSKFNAEKLPASGRDGSAESTGGEISIEAERLGLVMEESDVADRLGEALIQTSIGLLAAGRAAEAAATLSSLETWAAGGWEWQVCTESPPRGAFDASMAMARWCIGAIGMDDESAMAAALCDEAFGALLRAHESLGEFIQRPMKSGSERDRAALVLCELQVCWMRSMLLEGKGDARAAADAMKLPITCRPLRQAHAALCRAVPKLRRAVGRVHMRRAELLLLAAARARGPTGNVLLRTSDFGTRHQSGPIGSDDESGEGEEAADQKCGVSRPQGEAEEVAAMAALEGAAAMLGDRDGRRALHTLADLRLRHGDAAAAAEAVERAGDGVSLRAAHLLSLQGREREAAVAYRQAAEAMVEHGESPARAWFARGMLHAQMAARLLQPRDGSSRCARGSTSAAAKLAARHAEEALIEALEAMRRALHAEAEATDSLHPKQLWFARYVFGTLSSRYRRKTEAAAALRAAAAMGETLMPKGGKAVAQYALANALSEIDSKAALAANDEALRWLQSHGISCLSSSTKGGRDASQGVGETTEERHERTVDEKPWTSLVPLVLYQRALLLGHTNQRTADAEVALQTLLSDYDSRHLPARLALSALRAREGRLEDADAPLRDALDKELALDPLEVAKLTEARARLWLHAHGAEIAKVRVAGSMPTATQSSRLEALVEELRTVLTLRPGSCAVRTALGWARWLAGDDKAAMDEFNKASVADGDDPLPSLYRAFITSAAISAKAEAIVESMVSEDPEHAGRADVSADASIKAAEPFRDAAAQLLRALPAHAISAPPELWAQVRRPDNGCKRDASTAEASNHAVHRGGNRAQSHVSKANSDPERVIMLATCVRQLAAAAESSTGRTAGEGRRAGAQVALPLYGFALELLAPLVADHGAAAIEASSVQLSRARLLWAAGDVEQATCDLEAASTSLDLLASHGGATQSIRRMAATAWCNVGVTREAAAKEAARQAANEAAAMATLLGGRAPPPPLSCRTSGAVAVPRRKGSAASTGGTLCTGGLPTAVDQLLGRQTGTSTIDSPGSAGIEAGVRGAVSDKCCTAMSSLPLLRRGASQQHAAMAQTAQAAADASDDPAVKLAAEAEACYARALARWPEHRQSLANLGALFVAACRPQEALVHLNTAVGLSSADADGLSARGGQAKMTGKVAEERLRGGIIEAAARNNRAVASADLGDMAAARRDLVVAALLDSTARVNGARVAIRANDWHAARGTLREMHKEAWRKHAHLRLRLEDKDSAPAQCASALAEEADVDAAAAQLDVLASLKQPVEGWCTCLEAGVADFGAAARLLFPLAAGSHPALDTRFTPSAEVSPPLTRWQMRVLCAVLGRALPQGVDGGRPSWDNGNTKSDAVLEDGTEPPEPLPPSASIPTTVKLDHLNEALDRQLKGDKAGAEGLLCFSEPLRVLHTSAGKQTRFEGALLLIWSARSRSARAGELAIDELHAAMTILSRAFRPLLTPHTSFQSTANAEDVQRNAGGCDPRLSVTPGRGFVSRVDDALPTNFTGMGTAGRTSSEDVKEGSELLAALQVELGVRLEEAGQLGAALYQYNEASERCPTHKPAIANAGRLLALQGDPIGAMERYQRLWSSVLFATSSDKQQQRRGCSKIHHPTTAAVHSELSAYLDLFKAGPSARLEESLTRQQVRVALAVERWRTTHQSIHMRVRGDAESRLASDACAELLDAAAADPARIFGVDVEPIWKEVGIDDALERLRVALEPHSLRAR